MKDEGIGQAHGKIILMGEHAVVHGRPALAIPFPTTSVLTRVTLAPTKTTIDCQFYTGLLEEMPELMESVRKTIQLSLELLNESDTPVHLTITSTIPAERGMGSSAAVAVSITRALFDFFDVTLSQTQLLAIVAEGEKIAHGNPSGLDALMTSSQTPYYYIKGETPHPIVVDLEAVLVVADTGKTGQTKEAVAAVATLLTGGDHEATEEKLTTLGLLVAQSETALMTNQAALLGSGMTAAHQLLQGLNVSSPELDRLVQTALDHQALGAKLTGGGRGGCMLALAPERETALQIAAALEKNGAKSTWLYEMSEKM